ncbi:uncharacterized protein LOC116767868 isoform X1 [Danaus plexippus]|uniref:uncharacterized protein LOC116767868 isoform X1 n=1 Tax=Danaus plexippus TaxID=13037 RepID=UPI002AB2C8C0|nr:uncharacterized protein LOC116767868 isoform X1 [Danaus plexippus]
MQCNYSNPLYQNAGCNIDPFTFGKPPPCPNIIGEGDVASVIFPDGTVQLYFIPANRQAAGWPRCPFNPNIAQLNNLNFSTNPDVWIVRSISHPFTTSCWNRTIPSVYGDQLQPIQINSNFCSNSPPYHYYQKFHNDNCTSTTDIKYFYPRLRCDVKLKYSAEVQTEPFRICDVINTNERESQGHCCCKTQDVKSLKEERNTCYCSGSSTSYMSIDSSSKSKHRLRKKNKKKTKKSKAKTCECDEKTKSDKSVTTYADCACGSAARDGAHTQTNKKTKSKRKDTKTDSWIPLDSCKCDSSLRICESDYSYYGKCSCDSTSDAGGK